MAAEDSGWGGIVREGRERAPRRRNENGRWSLEARAHQSEVRTLTKSILWHLACSLVACHTATEVSSHGTRRPATERHDGAPARRPGEEEGHRPLRPARLRDGGAALPRARRARRPAPAQPELQRGASPRA